MQQITSYKPGLALLLVEKKQYSFLSGLNKRYPLAWQRRGEYPYSDAKCFSDTGLEREYYVKLAYALCEYAEQNEALSKELSAKIMSFFPKYEKYKSNFIEDGVFTLSDYCSGFILSEILGNLRCVTSRNEMYTLIIYSVALFFAKQEGLEFKSRANKLLDEIFIDFFEKSIETKKILDGGNTLSQTESKSAKSIIKASTKGLITAYNKSLDTNVYKTLPELIQTIKPSMLDMDPKTAVYYQMNSWFNQDLFVMIQEYKLMSQDIDQIFYNIIQTWTNEDVQWENPNEISEETLREVDTLLVYTTILYICSKVIEDSREFYWKDMKVTGQVESISKALEFELEKVKGEKEQLALANQKQRQELEDWRGKSDKLVAESIKAIKDELNNQKRENRQKEQEIIALKQRIEQLELELDRAELELEKTIAPVEDVKLEELIEKLNKPNILISPGHQNLVNKMKEVLPKAKFYELDKSYQNNAFNGVTHVFINKKYFNHGKYYKIKMALPEAPIYRITRTKIDLVLSEMAEAMGL